MGYEQHLRAAETQAWQLETSIDWDAIDATAAASRPWILDALYDAALIEGYLPVYLPRLMQAFADDIDATAVFSLELFEGLKHYTALRRYLGCVGYEKVARIDVELAEARRYGCDGRAKRP